MSELKLSGITIGAESDKVNKNFFDFMLEAKEWAEENDSRFHQMDGYWGYGDRNWVEGASFYLLDLNKEDTDHIQEMGETWGITRLEYNINVDAQS